MIQNVPPTKAEVIEAYTKGAETYDKTRFESKIGRYYDEVEKFRILQQLKGPRILELGCGSGRYGVAFAKLGFDYTGIDITPALLEVAKKKARRASGKIKLLKMDAHKLAFKDKTFNSVFCDRTFKYFQEPVKVLREAKRVLMPSGRIIIDAETVRLIYKLPGIRIMSSIYQSLLLGRPIRVGRRIYFGRYYKKEKVEAMFRLVEFRILESSRIISLPTIVVWVLPQIVLRDLIYEKSAMGKICGPKVLIVGER